MEKDGLLIAINLIRSARKVAILEPLHIDGRAGMQYLMCYSHHPKCCLHRLFIELALFPTILSHEVASAELQ